MTYKPLTKIVTEGGKEFVTCRFYGTETCQKIHSPNGCDNSCPMFVAILNQLHAFEETYLEEDRKNG